MKTAIGSAAAVTLFATQAAHAQEAVQWKVSDGGNGHWYGVVELPPLSTWNQANAMAKLRAAHLATLTSSVENDFAAALSLSIPGAWTTTCFGTRFGPIFGAYQDRASDDYVEPAGGWRWVTGEPWSFEYWSEGGPNDTFCLQVGSSPCSLPDGNSIPEDYLQLIQFSGDGRGWNDTALGAISCAGWLTPSAILEWSADCNGDGIVDYGQCRDGTLPDFNSNSVPDCCESGVPCVLGQYPVQWRSDDGGNGHWYAIDAGLRPYGLAESAAASRGAHLATIGSAAEDRFVYGLGVASIPGHVGVWLGGAQSEGACEPGCGWAWVTGEPWSYTNWASGEPSNLPGYNESRLHYWSGFSWNDAIPEHSSGSALEWGADCNSDGIVDYGQILQGQLADTNADGVPDVCQPPTCVDADLFRDFDVNGADLGILLSQWGPNTPLTVSDINGDGVVSGADLGLLLSFWGACP